MTFSLYLSSFWRLVLALPARSSKTVFFGTTAPAYTTPKDPSPMRSPTTKSLILRLRRPSALSSARCSGASTYVSTAPLSTPGRAVRYSHVAARNPNSAHRCASDSPDVSASRRDSAPPAARATGLDDDASRCSSALSSPSPSGTAAAPASPLAAALDASSPRSSLTAPAAALVASPTAAGPVVEGSSGSAVTRSFGVTPSPALLVTASDGSVCCSDFLSSSTKDAQPSSLLVAPHLKISLWACGLALALNGWRRAGYFLTMVAAGGRREAAMASKALSSHGGVQGSRARGRGDRGDSETPHRGRRVCGAGSRGCEVCYVAGRQAAACAFVIQMNDGPTKIVVSLLGLGINDIGPWDKWNPIILSLVRVGQSEQRASKIPQKGGNLARAKRTAPSSPPVVGRHCLGFDLPGLQAARADARRLFDRMPPRRRGKGGKKAPRVSGASSIESLPDGVLEHILGFLPARDAVRSCVLARRWRDLWMSASGLRITGNGKDDDMDELREFVDHLLLLRGIAPLETCELRFTDMLEAFSDNDILRVNLWFQHAVRCQARVLRLVMETETEYCFDLYGLHLVSRHLMQLELIGVEVQESFLNLSECPALEQLEIENCELSFVNKISSESLKRLSVTKCAFNESFRTCIHAPSLVSLLLDDNWYNTPVLESMPSLVDASIRIVHNNVDSCDDCDSGHCSTCHGIIHSNSNSILLDGLSKTTNLALIAESKTFIFRMDLKRCPTFSKLKTLLLSDYWCVALDLDVITCILKNSPLLEKLTLEHFLKGSQHMEMEGRYIPGQRTDSISEHLKIVVVKCDVVDEKVRRVLKLLSTFNIRFGFN